MRKIGLFIVLLLIASTISAQEPFNAPPESGAIFAISTTNGLSIGTKEDLPTTVGTVDVDWNPVETQRWARADNFGILRFFPEGQIGEGVYTFPPFFDGYQANSGAENKLFVREVEWSPDGEKLAFRIENNAMPDLNQGVWFWTPIFELSTDPAYQILRHCPPFCTAAGTQDNDPGWRSTNLEWSSDNNAILIGLRLLGDNRRAITVRFAERDEQITQAGTAPAPLRYDYGHWATDGQRVIVSGNNPEGQVVFGIINRTGETIRMTGAGDIGMAWVQNAIQAPDGNVLMLGSSIGENSPMQIISETGDILSAPIGDSAPNRVEWSPARDAILVWTNSGTYVANTEGAIYDLTNLVLNSPNISWVRAGLPSTVAPLIAPLPSLELFNQPEPAATPELVTAQPQAQVYNVGDLLVVNTGSLEVYNEPVSDATILGVMAQGQELIITSAPLNDGTETWYRIQSLDYTGWIRTTDNLVPPQG